ncbi:MAG: phosphatase PAP2 family protein [Bergeyella sp.]
MLTAQNSFLLKISKFISNFFNPLTSFFLYILYFSIKNYTWKEASEHFLPVVFIMIVPIIIWIVRKVRTGKYTNMDVSDRHERKSLYFFIAGVIGVYLLYDYFFRDTVDFSILFLLILLLVMQFSNYFIKSSMHTAFNVFVSALFFVQDYRLGIFWFVLSVLVGITRIILKRHTPKEVLSGGLIASVISAMYFFVYLNSQYQP